MASTNRDPRLPLSIGLVTLQMWQAADHATFREWGDEKTPVARAYANGGSASGLPFTRVAPR